MTIINNSKSFKKTKKFLQRYFQNVRVVKNNFSDLAKKSQNYYSIILFENRGNTFSVRWNYCSCTLFFGDITIKDKTCLQYTFTRMRYDDCYPIEEMNNSNIMFWEYEIVSSNDDKGREISPLRLPISLKKASNG